MNPSPLTAQAAPVTEQLRSVALPHITVCICTFRRPEMLARLLESVAAQNTDRQFTFSVVVTDNDAAQSGKAVTETFARRTGIATTYCTEPRQNIALARNRALAHATGDYIAFIDDDEFPLPEWLHQMLKTCGRYHAAGVLGPVRPHFDAPPPSWVLRGRFCERPEHATGTVMPWNRSRTGNLLFRRSLIAAKAQPFDPAFGTGGEDVDFFRQMTAGGAVFVWCNEAPVYETVPPSRCTRRFMLHRALLRGRNSLNLRSGRMKMLLTSVVAVPAYTLVLPISALRGQHHCMNHLIRFCDHLGRVLALVRLNPIKNRPM